uniref:Uncharacterized protein n=1 Tax=Setaria digitata TaxID=48799 RepID=A0A915PRS7_9BILA
MEAGEKEVKHSLVPCIRFSKSDKQKKVDGEVLLKFIIGTTTLRKAEILGEPVSRYATQTTCQKIATQTNITSLGAELWKMQVGNELSIQRAVARECWQNRWFCFQPTWTSHEDMAP